MTEAEFWKLLDSTSPGYLTEKSIETHIDNLYAALSNYSDEELIEYYSIYKNIIDSANSHELWGAAWIVPDKIYGPGCGDDEFVDFRAGLISRGQETFDRVMTNPDLVADVPFAELLKSGYTFVYAAKELYGHRHEDEMSLGEVAPSEPVLPPTGYRWEEDDVEFFRKTYPKCYAKWGLHRRGE